MTATQIAALATLARDFASHATDAHTEEWLTGDDSPAPALASLQAAKDELDAMFAFCMADRPAA